jgi:hypothetical protein
VILAIALVVGAGVFWILRRGRRGGAFAWKENACPVCVGLAVVSDRLGGDQRPTDKPSC